MFPTPIPFVENVRLNDAVLHSQDLLSSVAASDCTVIVTDHTGHRLRSSYRRATVIVDTRNALKGLRSTKIIRL